MSFDQMVFDRKTWDGFIEGPLAAAAEQGHIMQMASFTIGRNKPIFYFFLPDALLKWGADENAEQKNVK
jgi:hypothetical protein